MAELSHFYSLARKNIEPIVKTALHELGDTPILYLDSGAVIHFEKTVNLLRKASSNRFGSVDFYKIFDEICPKSFVTSYVFDEIDRHCKCHSVNGYPEISCETVDIMSGKHKSLYNFIREAQHQKPYDQIRYDVFWAGLLSFPQNHKKFNGDRISQTDRDLIASCVDTRYTEGVTGVAVLTTDAHISRTIDVLTGRHSTAKDNYDAMIGALQAKIFGDSSPGFPFLENTLFDYNKITAVNLMETKR